MLVTRLAVAPLALALAALTAVPVSNQKPTADAPVLLPLSRQIAVREDWLEKRHAMLLPLMRKHGVSMWIVVNEEFHDDPLTLTWRRRALTRGTAISSCSSMRAPTG